jgi:isoleucyl-tRNA synthetase
MQFQKGRQPAIEYEKNLVKYWKDNQTFEKSVSMRPEGNAFVFYDGPPFLTGSPHHGHLLISSAKDAMARYQTMKGKRVERRWGWDCHGLPAEVFVEKQLGIANKKEIGTKISVRDYVNACRSAMVQTGTEWEDTIARLGRWVEFKDAYKTMDNDYMESVWWAFKTMYENGKVYEGEKILIYCTQDATPISKSEVAMENSYQQDTDPSVYVFFQLKALAHGEPEDEFVLAWTTTPWTLPANVAIAVNSEIEYLLVEHAGKKFYIAKDAIERVMQDERHVPIEHKVLKTVKGSDLVGRKYHPLFANRGPDAHVVLDAAFVTASDGTGIVHEAPAYGEEDYELCKQVGVPIVSIVDENGLYTEGPWQGKNIWEVNKEIAKTLVTAGKALKIEYITHEYPHCHRCGSKLMYRAHPSWFMDIQAQKQAMLASNEQTNWVPKNLQEGRFKNILETAPDWNLSRDRYWATPIPVWRGVHDDGTEIVKVIGSYAELEQLSGARLEDFHLPNVMDLTFEYEGTTLHHIGKVLDCWFESGSMPFAQFHYPFENKQKFEANFPADFIIEAIDQTRGWFYALTAVNVALFGQAPFKNLICTGFINAADGRKMSKKLKNYTDPVELMDKYSADSFRFLMMSSPLTNGENFALVDKEVADVARKLSMVWNMYDFFTLYAEVDKWDSGLSGGELPKDPSDELNNPLDQWIVSRVHQLNQEVDGFISAYDFQNALKPILPFIDDASNWYVRRSRKRFWKSDNDSDKQQAYRTLHYVLVQLSLIMAPFTPFLSEELYRKLCGGESVHLCNWPESGLVNETAVKIMAEIRPGIEQGLAQRAEHKLKVRQPLASAKVYLTVLPVEAEVDYYKQIVLEELNVKKVKFEKTETLYQPGSSHMTELNFNLTDELRAEGTMREIVRNVQQARKVADLLVDDRINLWLESDDAKLLKVLKNSDLTDVIKQETLGQQLNHGSPDGYAITVKVDGAELKITLAKV